MRKVEDTNFCYYPFFQILITAEGKYRPCSKHEDHIYHQGKILTTANATLQDAWNSDYMNEMRQDFLNNKQFRGCGECWRLQKMGLKSMRYDSYQYNITEAQVNHPVKPVRIEINASNVCNLRCRICSPTASSKWIVEGKKVYGWNEKIHLNMNQQNLQQVKDWADHLEEICFFGGEPLLSEENLQLLDYCIANNLSGNISLLFNTNGTIFNDEIDARLRKFKRVRFFFSIDDIGPRFEYQRSGANWAGVEANLNKVYALTKTEAWKHIDFKICCTVSSLNIYYFPEYFDYFNEHFPGLKIFWNLLYDSWELSVQILPDEVKNNIRSRLLKIKPSFEWDEDNTKTIETLLTYLDYKVDKPFAEFFNHVSRHDNYRQENFAETFPEFWELIAPYKPGHLTMSQLTAQDMQQQQAIQNLGQYQHLSFVEQFRLANEQDLLNSDTKNELIKRHVLGALAEVAQIVDAAQAFNSRLAELELLFAKSTFNTADFIRDFLVFGAFKIFKAINDIDTEQIQTVLTRKYPALKNEQAVLI